MTAILSTDQLTKKFGALTAVDSVSIDIEKGEFLSIIGPNGAGKTTFFNVLSGRMKPTDGTITFREEHITELPPYELVDRGIARSFQITNVFSELTLRENVMAAVQGRADVGRFEAIEGLTDIRNRSDELLRRVGITEDPEVKAEELSYGMQRRLEIAIILGLEPELVLLDEPAAGLNKQETNELMDLISDIGTDRTIVLIEHDMNVVMKMSDRIVVLHNGAVLENDRPPTVQESEDVQRVYMGGV